MENLNETRALAVVPRVLAVALAVAFTGLSSIGTAAVLTQGAGGTSQALVAAAIQPLRIFFGA